ncbi:MAG: hypothetical protein FJ147_21035 [Deltaproteobacteria bacterium]|nr:hypothetical protein [Deltaproteobacteria bacterium]
MSDSPQQSPPRKFLRFALWTTALLSVALIVLVIGLSRYTQTDSFRAWLREQTLVALREEIHGEVTLERISGDLWNGVTFHNLSFRDASGDVIHIPQATVTLKLLSQLRLAWKSSTFHIDDVTVQSPTLHLREQPQGIWNIKRLFPPSSAPSSPTPLRLSIDRIHITDGHVVVEPHGFNTIQIRDVIADGQLTSVLPDVTLNFTQLSFRAESAQFPSFSWKGGGTYTEVNAVADVAVKAATIQTAQSQVQLSGMVHNLDAPRFDLTAEVSRLAANELRSLLPESPLQQDLSGQVQLSGTVQHPIVKAELQTANGKVTGIAKADFQQSPPHYDIRANLDRIMMHKVVKLPHVQGELSGHIEFTGSDIDSGKIDFILSPKKLVVDERTVGDGEISGTLVNRRLTSNGKTNGPLAQLQWNGWIELGPSLSYEGTIAIREGNVANATAKPLPIGTVIINADAWIAGQGTTLSDLTANTRITVLPSRVDTLTDVHGSAVATLRQQQLTLERLSLTTNDTTAHVQGQLKDIFTQSPLAALSYKIQTQDIAPWLKRVGQNGQGSMTLTGDISGPLQQLTVIGAATGNSLRWGQHALENGSVTYRLLSVGQAETHGNVTVAGQQLDAGGIWHHATVEATIVRVEPLEIQSRLHAEGEQVRNLRAQVYVQQQPTQWNVSLSNLALQLPIGVWTQSQPISFTLRAGHVSVDSLVLQRGAQSITVAGNIAEHGPQDFQVHVTQFPLLDLQTFVPTLPPVDGHLNINLQVQGTRTHPVASAQLTTTPLLFRGQSYAGLAGQGTYQNDKLTLSALLRQDTAHTLTLNGTLPIALSWHERRPMPQVGDADLRLHSDGINLAFLGLVTTDAVEDIEGTMHVDLALRGPLSELRPSGQVQLRNGGARLKTLDITLKDLETAIAISPDAFHLQQFSLSSGRGELTGNGRIALRQSTLGDMALTFAAKELRVIHTRHYKAEVSGRLLCSGSLAAPLVRGTLTLENTILRPDVALLKSGPPPRDHTITVVQTDQDSMRSMPSDQSLKESPREFDNKLEVPTTPELLRQLAADVVVRIPRDTWLHMAEGSIEINGRLTVKKNSGTEPRLTGAVETVRGWYAFHGRKFNIERGQVSFPDVLPVEPNIDLVARYTVAPYEVDVLLGGSVRTPTLDLRSNPALEEADILSVLIFGKPASGLSSTEQVSLQTQAIQATAGYIASGLRQSIANKLGLDNLEFDMGQSIGQGRVRVGKYLIKDVYVSTSQQLGERQEREVSVEYQVDRQWQLKGTTTSRGTSGVDVLWQKRY